MCYAIPGRVIAIEGRRATLEYFGESRPALHEFADLTVGEFVYAQGGYVISRVPDAEALASLGFWKETFARLHEQDLRLSRLNLDRAGVDPLVLSMFDRVLGDGDESPLSEADLLALLRLDGERERAFLYQIANHLRHRRQGNSCCVHGIIEISSHCHAGCGYCGISRHHTGLSRFRLSAEEIFDAVGTAIDTHGFKALVLQSGEDPGRSVEELSEIVAEIRRRWAVLVFVSFGEVGIDGLEKLFTAGARGLLMRFETSNPELFQRLRPGRTLETRLEHLRAAERMGYLLITGALIGLPGATIEDRLRDILLARSLRPDMYSFGPFLPHPATPLAAAERATIEATRQTLAVCRLSDPRESRLVVTTAFETLDPLAREHGLTAGANSLMLNLTPDALRPAYDLYPGRAHAGESIPRQIESALELLTRLGRAPSDIGTERAAHSPHRVGPAEGEH